MISSIRNSNAGSSASRFENVCVWQGVQHMRSGLATRAGQVLHVTNRL